jgi:serine/threonine-protein kinase HipA
MTMSKPMRRCLYCYKGLEESQEDFHPVCSHVMFGTLIPPTLSLSNEELEEMGREIVSKSVAIAGVQPKLSLTIQANPDDPKKSRLTIVGMDMPGADKNYQFILKPQTEIYPHLPENEDLTMHLADISGITTAKHSLLRADTGQLAYITRRFDRSKGRKIPMEDFCQLMEKQSSGNSKYESSMEKLGKAIKQYSSVPGVDVIKYFEMTVFSFLVGNSDMHLKNFSIIKDEDNQYRLSPAYDLVSSNLAMPDDKEQMALTMNARKNKIKRKDFQALASTLQIPASTVEIILSKYSGYIKSYEELISISFLPDDLKEQYISLVQQRAKDIE